MFKTLRNILCPERWRVLFGDAAENLDIASLASKFVRLTCDNYAIYKFYNFELNVTEVLQ